jgi:hypothetical protein
MNLYQASQGLTVIDAEDTYESTDYTFGGLADILDQLLAPIAGATKIPQTRLQGRSPAGLNATGESDWQNYYGMIHAQQEAKLRDSIEVMLRIAWRSTFGTPPPEDLAFEFNPLWESTDKQKAELAQLKTNTILAAFTAEVISVPTVLKELRDLSKDAGLFHTITDEDIEKAEQEAALIVPQPDPADLPGLHPELQRNIEDPLDLPTYTGVEQPFDPYLRERQGEQYGNVLFQPNTQVRVPIVNPAYTKTNRPALAEYANPHENEGPFQAGTHEQLSKKKKDAIPAQARDSKPGFWARVKLAWNTLKGAK